MLIRTMVIMDEKESLVIGRGILPEWVRRHKKLAYGPTLTPFGRLSVEIDCRDRQPVVKLSGDWYEKKPREIVVWLPEHKKASLRGPDYQCTVAREE
jgi:hypothetical protein